MSPATWIGYPPGATCDTGDCAAAATVALVRLDASGTFAASLLRLACAEHGPAVAEPER